MCFLSEALQCRYISIMAVISRGLSATYLLLDLPVCPRASEVRSRMVNNRHGNSAIFQKDYDHMTHIQISDTRDTILHLSIVTCAPFCQNTKAQLCVAMTTCHELVSFNFLFGKKKKKKENWDLTELHLSENLIDLLAIINGKWRQRQIHPKLIAPKSIIKGEIIDIGYTKRLHSHSVIWSIDIKPLHVGVHFKLVFKIYFHCSDILHVVYIMYIM